MVAPGHTPRATSLVPKEELRPVVSKIDVRGDGTHGRATSPARAHRDRLCPEAPRLQTPSATPGRHRRQRHRTSAYQLADVPRPTAATVAMHHTSTIDVETGDRPPAM